MTTLVERDEPGRRADARPIDRGLVILLVMSLLGLGLGLAFLQVDDQTLRRFTAAMSTIMFRSQDTPWFLVLSLVTLGLILLERGVGPGSIADTLDRAADRFSRAGIGVPLLALGVVVFVALGTFTVHHGFVHSADEYIQQLQAAIFAEGRLMAPVDPEWGHLLRARHPYFIFHDEQRGLFAGDYRPVYAAILALFDVAGIARLTNAVLTAASVVLVAAVARRLWPDRRDAAILACALLATSPQVLFTGMTVFAWPAHLFFNLLWLWLFLRDDARGHLLAALVGFFAVGLHQVHVHAFFVLPFMLGLLVDRRWRLAAFYLVAYGAGHALWVFWHDVAIFLIASDSVARTEESRGIFYLMNALRLFDLTDPAGYLLIGQNLLRLVAWQNPILIPLVVAALTQWSKLSPVLRRLAWSCALSMIPYVLIMPNQTFAWGYRYMHGNLGNMALLAAFGWILLSSSADMKAQFAKARRAMLVFALASLLIALPMRAWQVDDFLAPMAKTLRHIEEQPSEVVLVDAWDIWFGWDLARNDPFLRDRPVKLALQYMTLEQLREVCARHQVRFVSYQDVAHLGVPFVDRYENPEFDFSGRDRELLAYARGPECRSTGTLPARKRSAG